LTNEVIVNNLIKGCLVEQRVSFHNPNVTYNLKGCLMGEEIIEIEKRDTCMMHERGSQEPPNLCCCYIIDSDGVDPCYRPVADVVR